tara:strand:- start:581 stop:2251 length:1671 start_codon:yes stop_codon:yes gene_type:complete
MKLFLKIIIAFTFLFFNRGLSQNIGCADTNSVNYDPSANTDMFSGYVLGGSNCNQSGWGGNYIGIDLEYYYLNSDIFQVGNEILFGEYIYYIDAIDIPTNCNSGVALIYVVTEQSYADNNPWTFQNDIEWPFIPIETTWSVNACLCSSSIDCDNICNGNNFSCIDCQQGDINNDNTLDIFDIILLSDCISNGDCNECVNLNNDNNIDALDILFLIENIINQTEGCLDPNACNYNPNVSWQCDDCCNYESMFYDCGGNCLIDQNEDNICDNIPYEEYFIGMDLTQEIKDLFTINAIRFEEICLNNFNDLKNPLWTINQTGAWPIYYHVESWIDSVNSQAITNLTNQYESIAHDWLDGLQEYDNEAPSEVDIKVFGFVFNEGVEYNSSFYETYNTYPIISNYNLTNEESPWEIRFLDTDQLFDQNWYVVPDFLDLYVFSNRNDLENSLEFYPNDWNDYIHPESIEMFVTKFWHKTTWDAVAQRQYLKIGGQISDYQTGEANYRVFAHEMGHCFFLDDIYDPGKYPDGQNLISIMNNSTTISDFDKFLLRLVWNNQKNN